MAFRIAGEATRFMNRWWRFSLTCDIRRRISRSFSDASSLTRLSPPMQRRISSTVASKSPSFSPMLRRCVLSAGSRFIRNSRSRPLAASVSAISTNSTGSKTVCFLPNSFRRGRMSLSPAMGTRSPRSRTFANSVVSAMRADAHRRSTEGYNPRAASLPRSLAANDARVLRISSNSSTCSVCSSILLPGMHCSR